MLHFAILWILQVIGCQDLSTTLLGGGMLVVPLSPKSIYINLHTYIYGIEDNKLFYVGSWFSH